MTKLFWLALVACGGAAAAPTPTPAPTVPPCDIAGTWELTVEGKGCPLPRNVTLVDGKGHSLNGQNVAAMDWTLTATKSSTGTCEVELHGSAGQLFSTLARGTHSGTTLTASGRSSAGRTAYVCGGDVNVTGARR